MKVGEPQIYPYLPLQVDNPALLQRESLDVDQQVSQQSTEQKSREIVAQQAGAHAHAQIRQDKFVDPSQTVQGQSRALLEQKPSVSKRGLKRSLANGFEQRDLSQGPLSTAFQRAAARQDNLSEQKGGARSSKAGTAQDHSYLSQPTISQQSLGNQARKPIVRSSVQAAAQAALRAASQSAAKQAPNISPSETAGSPQQNGNVVPNNSFEMGRVQDALQGFRGHVEGDWGQAHQALQKLSGPELNQALAQLDGQLLGQWLDGFDRAENGLTTGDKSQVFDRLARGVSGQQLGRVLGALTESGGMAGDLNVHALGQSIASGASSEAKADFVRHAVQGMEPGSNHGVAIAQALGGLKEQPALVQELLQGMSEGQIRDVVSQATRKNVSVSMNLEAGPTMSTSYNAQPLAEMLGAVSQIQDPRTKASVAAASYDMLNEIEGILSTPTEIVAKNNSDTLIREGLAKLGVLVS